MKAHDAQALYRKLSEMLALPAETEWLEFKQASRSFHFDKLGQYFSALSNEARLKKQEAGWLIFGVQNHPRKIAGTDFRRNRADLDNLKKKMGSSLCLTLDGKREE
jgi:ATP-dependent DNA helicase RecG